MEVVELKKKFGNRFIDVIEPNTMRVIEKRKMREEEERKKKERQEKEKEDRREKEKLKEFQSKKKEEEEKRRMELKREEERRRQDEQNVSSKLSGRFGHMINDLNSNLSNLEFTISGLDLRPAQIKVLVNSVSDNTSLKALAMTRKKINDGEGRELISKLEDNSVLERLELEGNMFGPKTLEAVAKLLEKNKTVRSIDLEGNKLIVEYNEKKEAQKNLSGIKHLVEALKVNETLLWLNLFNTGLNQECSRYLRDIFRSNTTIIHIDIEGNPDMNMEDVKHIQNCLLKNKQQYYEDRLNEFHERKRMKKEEDISHIILLDKETRRYNEEMIAQNIKFKKEQMDQDWEEFLKKEEQLHLKMLVKLEKEAKMKKKKKKKKAA